MTIYILRNKKNFSKRAQTTGPKTLKFASLLGQEEGPLGQWPSSYNVKRCPAYEIARTLFTAQKNPELYMLQSHQVIPTNVVATSTDEQANLSINADHESLAAVKSKTPRKKSCYFYGGFLHANRASCPARDAVCPTQSPNQSYNYTSRLSYLLAIAM